MSVAGSDSGAGSGSGTVVATGGGGSGDITAQPDRTSSRKTSDDLRIIRRKSSDFSFRKNSAMRRLFQFVLGNQSRLPNASIHKGQTISVVKFFAVIRVSLERGLNIM